MTSHSLQIHSDLATPAKVDFVVLTRETKQIMVTYKAPANVVRTRRAPSYLSEFA